MIGKQLELFPKHNENFPSTIVDVNEYKKEKIELVDERTLKELVDSRVQDWIRINQDFFNGNDELNKIYKFLNEVGAHKFDPFTGEKYSYVERIRSYKGDVK